MATFRTSNQAAPSLITAADWWQNSHNPSIHASTNITINAVKKYSQTFAGPAATGEQAVCVILPFVGVGTAGTLTADLEESGVVVATVSIAVSLLKATNKAKLVFTVPYGYTSMSSIYRISLVIAGGSGTTTVAADSGGANFSCLVFDDRTGAPGTNENIVDAAPNQSGSVAISADGDASFGDGSDTSYAGWRSWGIALDLYNNANLVPVSGVDVTLTIKGSIYSGTNGGGPTLGSTASPLPLGNLFTIEFDENGVTGNYGWVHASTGKSIVQGEERTTKKATIVSGAGTTASPLVVSGVTDFAVGDHVGLAPAGDSATNYNESEEKYIRSIVDDHTFTLADTLGGAETAGLTYVHDGSECFNLTRAILITTTDPTKGWYYDANEISSDANVDFNGWRGENVGSTLTNKLGFRLSNLASEKGGLDDVVFYNGLGTSYVVSFGNNNDIKTHSWCIAYKMAATGNAGAISIGSYRNKTFENMYPVNCAGAGFYCAAITTCAFVDCVAFACGKTVSTANNGWRFQNSSNATMSGCGAHACRQFAIELSTMAGLKTKDCAWGTVAKNQGGQIYCVDSSYNVAVFQNDLFDESATLVSQYLLQSDGSSIAFHDYNQTHLDHRFYTAQMTAQSCGAGLPDTNRRNNLITTDSLNLRLAPEDATIGGYFDFRVLARANSYASIIGFIQKNAAMGTDPVTVDLYLPGLIPGIDTPSATVTMTDNTSFNVFGLQAQYDETFDAEATIRITAKSVAVGAYVYIADFFNGTNEYTALKVWREGKPSATMFEQLGDQNSTWAVALATLTTPGTIGEFLANPLVAADVWDADASAMTTPGSIGELLTDTTNILNDPAGIWAVDIDDITTQGSIGQLVKRVLTASKFLALRK